MTTKADPGTPIRRRPDGSIDTDHYIAFGRAARAAQAAHLARALHEPTPGTEPRAPRGQGRLARWLRPA